MEDKNWEPSGIVWGSDPQDTDTGAQEDYTTQDTSSHDGFGSGPRPSVHKASRPAFISRGGREGGRGGKKRGPLKTVGIVILVLFVLSLLSRACGRKDTASVPQEPETNQTQTEATQTETAQPQTEQAGQAEASTPTTNERKDRAGYHPETNGQLSYGGIQFGIPSYFRKAESENQSSYILDALDPSEKIIEAQLQFVSNEFDNLSENFIAENGDNLQNTIVKSLEESGRNPEVRLSEDVTIAGQAARHVIIHGTREEEGVTIHVTFLVSPQNDRLISVFLISIDNAYYDYTNDYYNIMRNAVAEEVKEPEEEQEEASGDLDPDFKKMMDDYEAFFDRYVEFMNKFTESSDTTALLSDYMEFITQYTEVMEELDALDTDDMSAAEYAYYTEVMARISKKLLEAAQ